MSPLCVTVHVARAADERHRREAERRTPEPTRQVAGDADDGSAQLEERATQTAWSLVGVSWEAPKAMSARAV